MCLPRIFHIYKDTCANLILIFVLELIVCYFSGDIFDTEVTRTWEFNSTFPLRSIVIPKLLFSPVFYLIKSLSDAGVVILNGWMIISSTRFVMAVLSLWIDFCVFKVLKFMRGDYSKGLLLVAGSYVTLTYQCHTFTNSFETLLFSSLMYVIFLSSTQVISSVENKHSEKKSKFVVTGTVIENQVSKKPVSLYCASLAFGLISVAGVFNRPTFVIFSILPTLWWLYLLLKFSDSAQHFVQHTILMIASAAVTAAVFCFVDSLYFKDMSIFDLYNEVSYCLPFSSNTLICLKTVFETYFVFTPWNFVKYNTKGENLAEHGLHPFYLHVCVNMPLLFGPLVYYLLRSMANSVKTLTKVLRYLPKIDRNKLANIDIILDAKLLLTVFILFPVLLFSIFPHQEPRFLSPLLPVMILLTCISVKSFTKLFIASFIVFNVILTIIFGMMHQGGLIPCILSLQTLYNTNKIRHNSSVSYNFIFSHTYMPPQFPLLIKGSNVKVYDTKGAGIETVIDLIQDINKSIDRDTDKESRIFLVIPSEVYKDKLQGRNLNITLVEKFYPHLSFEDLPRVAVATENTTFSFYSIIKQIYDQLFLILLEINS